MASDLKKRRVIWRLAAADFFYCMDPDLTAENLGIAPDAARTMRKSVAYRDFFDAFQAEESGKLKARMTEDAEKMRGAMMAMVPKAMMVIESALEDPSTAMKAAVEVLDRSGILPKTSRVQTQTGENVIPDVDDEIVKEFHRAVN